MKSGRDQDGDPWWESEDGHVHVALILSSRPTVTQFVVDDGDGSASSIWSLDLREACSLSAWLSEQLNEA